jgi:hypothetical protein
MTEALVLPICLFAIFRLIGVPRSQAILRRWASRLTTVPDTASVGDRIRNVCRAQQVVRRATGLGGSCLVQSLTLWAMLLRRGVSTDLRVGFRKSEGKIRGHAWIEHDGVPVNETLGEAQSYVPHEDPFSFDLRSCL